MSVKHIVQFSVYVDAEETANSMQIASIAMAKLLSDIKEGCVVADVYKNCIHNDMVVLRFFTDKNPIKPEYQADESNIYNNDKKKKRKVNNGLRNT